MPAIRTQILALGILALAAFGIERLIVTDAEAIENLAKDTAKALMEKRYEVLEDVLDESFEYQGKDRAKTIQHVRSLIEKHRPLAVEVRLPEVKIEDDTAKAAGYIGAQVYGRPIRYGIEVDLVRREDGWKLVKVKGSSGRLP